MQISIVLALSVVADLPNFCLHSDVMGEWLFHIGEYHRQGESEPDPFCGYNTPDNPGMHEHLRPISEGQKAHPTTMALAAVPDDGGIAKHGRGTFTVKDTVYMDLAHNWYAGANGVHQQAGVHAANATGKAWSGLHKAAGFWTMVYTEGFHIGLMEDDDGDGQTNVHSFRAFNYYWLSELQNESSKEGQYAFSIGASPSTGKNRNPLTNSPDENAKYTNCGRTMLGWYVIEKHDRKRTRMCMWGHKIESPVKNHYGSKNTDEEGSFAQAEFGSDGEVKLARKVGDRGTKDAFGATVGADGITGGAAGAGGEAAPSVSVHVTVGGPAAPVATPAAENVARSAVPMQAPERDAEPLKPSAKKSTRPVAGAHVSEDQAHETLAKLTAKVTGMDEGEMHKHVKAIKEEAQRDPSHPFNDKEYLELLKRLTHGMADLQRLGIQKQQQDRMGQPKRNPMLVQEGGGSAPGAPKFTVDDDDLGEAPTPVWNIKGLTNSMCPYSYVTQSSCKGPEGAKDCKAKRDTFNWQDVDASCPEKAWEGDRHHGSHIPHTNDMPSVESQQCGTCYAVASSTALTARLFIKYPKLKERWQKSKVQQKGNSSGIWTHDGTQTDTRISWGHASQCIVYNQGCDGGFPYWVMTGWSDEGAKSTECFEDNPGSNNREPNNVPGSVPSADAQPEKCKKVEANRCKEDPDPVNGKHVSGIQIASWGYIGGAYGRCQVGQRNQKLGLDDASMPCEEYMKREIYRAGPIVVAIEPEGGFSIWRSGVLGKAAGAKMGPGKEGKAGVLHPDHFRNIEALEHVPAGRKMCPDSDAICYHYEKVDHSVVVFGWGEEDDGTPYWLLRNSWGNSFGDHGVIKVARGLDYLAIESISVAAEPIWVTEELGGFVDVDEVRTEEEEPYRPLTRSPYLSRESRRVVQA